MATYTDNYQLTKPLYSETADVAAINNNMDKIDDIMHSSQVSLAPAYDQNETYNTGDVVMYEFLMYECLEDNVTGVWDATKWQRTTAGQHGGGSNVEITPTLQSGTKIADFEINGVSGELYAPSGGGGGGGGAYVDRLIFDTYVAGNGTYELLESIDNYDALLVCGYGASGDSPTNFIMSQFVTKAEFYTKKIALLATVTGSTRRIFIQFPDSTHVTTSSKEGDISLRFIYGIKFGGGGGSSLIYDNTEKVVGTYFGETLYAKSYDIDNPSNNATIISEDFSDKVITEITATGIRSSDGAVIPLQFTTTSNWIRVYAGTIYGGVYLESNITISNIKITVKYTKSTT